MREVNFSKLKKEDGLFYFPHETTPFSGRAIVHFKLFLIPTKRIKRKTENRNGIPHGETLDFFRDGKIARKAYLKEGKFHGEMINYFESGEVKEKANYWDGLLHGEQIFYYENGNVMSKYRFDHGIKE